MVAAFRIGPSSHNDLLQERNGITRHCQAVSLLFPLNFFFFLSVHNMNAGRNCLMGFSGLSILFSNGKGLVGGAVCRGKTSFHRGSRSFLTSRIRNLQRAWNRTRARVTQKDGRAGKRRPHDRVQEVYVGTHTQALRRFLCEIAMPLQGYTLVFSTRQVLEIFSLRHHLIPLLPESLAWFFGGFYGAGLRLERARFRNLEGE